MIRPVGRLLPLCSVFVLLCGVGVAGFENKASAEPPPRLRAPRLSLSVAAPDVVLFGVAAGILFADAADRDSRSERNISLGLASAYTALFGMNLGWIVEAGAELTARLDYVDDRMNARTARIGTAFSVVDSAARASAVWASASPSSRIRARVSAPRGQWCGDYSGRSQRDLAPISHLGRGGSHQGTQMAQVRR